MYVARHSRSAPDQVPQDESCQVSLVDAEADDRHGRRPCLGVSARFDLIFLHPFLKSSYVLLDDDFNAKVSGFGLAKPSAEGSLPQGYKAPEYNWVRTGNSSHHLILTAWFPILQELGGWTKAVHVYSFGVVLMELLTGRPAVDLATWFRKEDWTKLGFAALHAAMDPHLVLGLNFHSDESTTVKSILTVAKLAMDCTADNPKARPDMDHAVSVLRCLLNDGGAE